MEPEVEEADRVSLPDKNLKRAKQIVQARSFLAQISDDQRRAAHRRRLWLAGAHAGAVIAIPDAELAASTPEQLIDAAAMHAEAGLTTRANILTDQALAADERILDRHSYVGLIASLAHLNPFVRERYAGEIALAERFRSSRGKFRALLADAKTIAVVGNGPSDLGADRGAEIDACDLVIRFNDYSTDPAFRPAYGSKVDVWCHSFKYENIWRRDALKPRHTLLAGLSLYWRTPNGRDGLVAQAEAGHTCEDTDARLYYSLTSKLGRPPSSGTVVLHWIADHLGSLDNVLTAGFSMIDQQNGANHYYESLPRIRAAPHDWAAEWEMFEALTRLRAS
jgi:hypothetical protein